METLPVKQMLYVTLLVYVSVKMDFTRKQLTEAAQVRLFESIRTKETLTKNYIFCLIRNMQT